MRFLLAVILLQGCGKIEKDFTTAKGFPVKNYTEFDILAENIDVAYTTLFDELVKVGYPASDLRKRRVHGYNTRILFVGEVIRCYVKNPETSKFEERECSGIYYRTEMMVYVEDELDADCLHRTSLQHEMLHYSIDKRTDLNDDIIEAGDGAHTLPEWDVFGALWMAEWALCNATCPDMCEYYSKGWAARKPENGGEIRDE